ncbi:MAG: DUF2256 domain-containing protein [Hyphomonadaceae bacterium]|nr:DUF2256 domain-containing protein [Hyphomonadaceae bacterium]
MAQGSRKTPAGVKLLKANLPKKLCAVCGKPFTWRKKWARDWESVKYCSERCRRGS